MWMDKATINLWSFFLSELGGPRFSLEKMKEYDGRETISSLKRSAKPATHGTVTSKRDNERSVVESRMELEFQPTDLARDVEDSQA